MNTGRIVLAVAALLLGAGAAHATDNGKRAEKTGAKPSGSARSAGPAKRAGGAVSSRESAGAAGRRIEARRPGAAGSSTRSGTPADGQSAGVRRTNARRPGSGRMMPAAGNGGARAGTATVRPGAGSMRSGAAGARGSGVRPGASVPSDRRRSIAGGHDMGQVRVNRGSGGSARSVGAATHHRGGVKCGPGSSRRCQPHTIVHGPESRRPSAPASQGGATPGSRPTRGSKVKPTAPKKKN